jgi:hypothetical protein
MYQHVVFIVESDFTHNGIWGIAVNSSTYFLILVLDGMGSTQPSEHNLGATWKKK